LRGGLNDPLVGRDLLLGAAAAALAKLAMLAGQFLEPLAGSPVDRAHGVLDAWSVASTLGTSIGGLGFALLMPMAGLTLLVLSRMLLRRPRVAIVATALVAWFFAIGSSAIPGRLAGLVAAVVWLLMVSFFLVLLTRVGLLAVVAAAACGLLLSNAPLTLDFHRWYAGPALVPAAITCGLALWGFWVSRGGQPLFGDAFAED
jgi:hypothetical protein